ncbi:DUF6443 domain-containing protein [Chryseobacterium culicis]|uniref:RHS repeat-associated core domain-containing protein n=1 Tax=Chryseobacterium culicis TaxID=680127 RepID=A0A1H6IML8_CHRCI|nr:DUF6443 domain-containing protein [Chryseobacterium culicis]SEH49265.1 RHS repeat-associated core domain-containing protein [Chryseobacterium culicis]
MKKIILLLNLFMAGFSFAQTNLTQTENYIYEKTCLTEDCSKKTESVQYLDGLGRAKQTIAIKATPSGKDIAVPIEYDIYGRQVKSYLPVPQSGTQNGALYANPLSNAASIYGNEKIYAEKVLESSPLARLQQQKQVGNDWTGHPVQFSYDANTSADEVKKYTVVTSWPEGRTNSELSLSGTYAENTLYKSTVTDEDGNITTEFKNKKGQTLLTRKKDGTQNADTYYVYNEYGGLAYTLPPLASASALTPAMVDNLCYQYRYDGWNRLVEKKIPGKGWEFMVYDKQNRLVLAQDAKLRTTTNNFAAKGWMFTKYDQYGRVAYTGFFANTSTRAAMQTAINNMSANAANNEARSTTSFASDGMDVYYTKNAFPTGSMKILSINYYDTYPSYSFNPPFPTTIMGKTVLSDNSTANAVSTKSLPVMSLVKNIEDDNWTKNYNYYDAKGRVIGTHSINHLGGYSKTESLLDFAGMPQQSKVWHKRLATDPEKVITQSFTYDQQNRLLVHKHQIDSNPEEILIQNEYNELSQLKNKKLGGTSPSQPLQNIDYTYNIRGWNTKINDPSNLNGKLFGYEMKYLSPVNSNVAPGKFSGMITEVDWKNASEDVLKRYNYSYDGLGRLKDAVYSEPNAAVPFNNYYNEHLTYDLNGNIKTLKRNAFPITGNTATQADDLVYDYTGNQLTKVTENALNDSGYEGGNNIITYDQNGNMKDMLDKGIQSIQYNYLNLSNQYTVQQSSAFGQMSYSTMNYLYRADGTKLRKTYSSAPPRGSTTTRITDYLDGFQYTYTEGGGICLECRTESAFEQQAYKNASFVFPGNPTPEWKLDFVSTAAGYYSFTENRYIYQYVDHLGNTRVSFAKNSEGVPEIIDTNNYYPFGLNHISNSFSNSGFGSFYSYKYNDKELQETGLFDYGWRQYMPDLGRWNGIDQLAESYLSTSPFAYVANNPVSSFDVDGRWMDDSGHITDTTGQTFGFLGSSYKPQGATNYLGVKYGDGGGNGSYTPFGRTQAYADLMTAFYNGATGGMSNIGGTLRWWTDYEDPDPTVTGVGAFGMLKLKNPFADSELYNSSQTLRKIAGLGFTFSKLVEAGYKQASVYGKPPAYATMSLYFEKSILGQKILSIKLPFRQLNVDMALKWSQRAKVAGRVLGGIGAGLALADIHQNGVTTSNSLDLVMSVLAVSPTGWGQAIAGTYFLANGITALITGKDIGQHIEGAVNKYYNDGVREEEQRKFNAAMGY